MTAGRLVQLFSRHPVVSDGFADWLTMQDVSLIFLAGGQPWIVGRTPVGEVHVAAGHVGQPMTSLCLSPEGVTMAGWQVWRFVDALDDRSASPEGHDCLLLPQTATTVGSIGINDVQWTADRLAFSSYRLGCLAELDDRWSFKVTWSPPWQTAITDEDRCHLGGFASGPDGRTWVTAAGRTDVAQGWKQNPAGNGVVCATGEGAEGIVCDGLTMPRAPRWYERALLVPDAGTGRLVRADVESGEVEELQKWPAACTALAVHGSTAIVGLSSPPGTEFEDLPSFEGTAPQPHDSLVLLDLETGQMLGTLGLEGRGIGIAAVAVMAFRWPEIATPRGPSSRDLVVIGPSEPV